MKIDLGGRVAVVTGGGRGIGAALARALGAAGARVCVAGRSEAALAEVGADLAARCDVTRPDDVLALRDAVRGRLGAASIVVNNAGVARSAKLADTDDAMWEETLAVNLTGAFRVTRAFAPDVIAAGARGRVINIASVAAKIGFAYTTAYCASKHGLLGFTRALALELAPKGATANCVCPGWVESDMSDEAIDRIARTTARSREDAKKELERMSPQRRLMTADEIAAVTVWLASDEARGVTGQAWNVDGGEVMS
jgi:NAD(P)-dependent dehydrogenase (short-subunit alcohol dehydrogenase family)